MTAPALTAQLHRHIATFGTAPDGRLFVGERSADHLPLFTVNRAWTRARRAVFGDTAQRNIVALRAYDLRHAAVSTWLNAGVPATQVAEWAGHSVEVLLKIYAKCIDGDADRHRMRIEEALGRPTTTQNLATYLPGTTVESRLRPGMAGQAETAPHLGYSR